MDGMLSQEEINALLSGMDSAIDNANDMSTESLSEVEKDAIGEVSNISMGTAATTLSSLVNQKVVITTPIVSYATWDDLANNFDRPCIFTQIYYKEGLDGNNILILKESDVKIITDLMLGGDGTNVPGDLSELHLSAISEAMNQMMGSASTSLSAMLERRVDITPPISSLVDLNESIDAANIAPFLKAQFVRVSFKMEIGTLVDSEIMQLYPIELAKDIYKKFMKEQQSTQVPENTIKEPTTVNTSSGENNQTMQMNSFVNNPNGQMYQGQMPNVPVNGGMNGMNYGFPPMQDINVSQVQFQPFLGGSQNANQPENINLIMDVPLEVTVELGRTSKSIKEILDFSPGTIIELNKLAGEPVDVLVNGKFVAKGEVVVIEESFGIRVTEIVK